MNKITTEQSETMYRHFKTLQSMFERDGHQGFADLVGEIITDIDRMQPSRFIIDSRWIWLDETQKHRHLKANDGKTLCGKQIDFANDTDYLILHCMDCMQLNNN